MNDMNDKEYHLRDSFNQFASKHGISNVLFQKKRAIDRIKDAIEKKATEEKYSDVIQIVLKDLLNEESSKVSFKITEYEADEMDCLDDKDIVRYLYHRYRYKVYPEIKKIDDYPPCLQIEPTSKCNYRCVFCYQSDKTFSGKKSGFMGTMSLDFFKKVIDQAEGNVDFITLASRGEPLLTQNIIPMLKYSSGKFINIKINTNASVLTEKLAHAIISSGVNTLVFSVDAAKESLYSQFRINGNFEKVKKNIQMFKSIREKKYPGSKILTRVSGVMYNPDVQDIDSMNLVWKPLVDQVSYVNYSPWEKIYESSPTSILSICSDLWRRMFVWNDGVVNPCDNDYKSHLKVGSIDEFSLSELWKSVHYQNIRNMHMKGQRKMLEPCKRCTVS